MSQQEESNSIDSFLDHKSSERGGGFLGNWKKDGKVNVFLHTRQMPVPIYFHGLPRKQVREEDGDPVIHVWSGKYNCWEEEATIRKQYSYDAQDVRTHPPQRCPLCRMIEAVRTLVNEGTITWTQPILKWAGDVDDETVIVHAGGFIGEFGGDLDDKEKAALKKAGISQREAWKENCRPKLNYIFWVVDADNVDKGLQQAQETGLLGDKVKDVIRDARESLGEDKGNPQKFPFCIQWEYAEQEKEFNKKYKARRIERISLTPAIEAIIRGPKPDITKAIARFDAKEVRSQLEAACYPDVRKLIPWDEVFAVAKRPETDHPDLQDVAEGDLDPADVRNQQSSAPADDDDLVKCDDGNGHGCGKPVKLSDPKCPHCGLVYDVTDEPKPEPPKPEPQRRSRAEAKAAAAAAGGTKKKDVPF